MLLTIAGILAVLWLLGLLVHIGGGFIHVLLIIALIVAVYHFVVKGRTKV
jgi:4-hydroxybenzoate polyprenyltransferase